MLEPMNMVVDLKLPEIVAVEAAPASVQPENLHQVLVAGPETKFLSISKLKNNFNYWKWWCMCRLARRSNFLKKSGYIWAFKAKIPVLVVVH